MVAKPWSMVAAPGGAAPSSVALRRGDVFDIRHDAYQAAADPANGCFEAPKIVRKNPHTATGDAVRSGAN
jgi:hypothetical protein